MTYDKKCYELAVHFLADHPDIDSDDTRDLLAQDIQQAIDDFFEKD